MSGWENPTIPAPIMGARGFAIGDSLTAAGYAASGAIPSAIVTGKAYLAWASLISKGRIFHAGESATAGFTSAQILATHLPVAIAARPDFCVVLAGTNDAALPIATTTANLLSMYRQLAGAGITPVLMTVPPRSGASGPQALEIGQLNAWIARTAAANRWPFVDVYALLVDTTTGNYLAAYDSGDGVHWNTAGAKVVGQAINDALVPWLPPNAPMLAAWNAETAYLLGNQLMLTDSNADGIPDNWAKVAGTAPVTTLPAAVAPGLGKLMTLKRAADDATLQSNAGALVAGHRYRLSFLLASTVKAAGGMCSFVLANTGATQTFSGLTGLWSEDIPANSIWANEFVVPAGLADSAGLLSVSALAAVNAQAQLGQYSLIDLTAAGIA